MEYTQDQIKFIQKKKPEFILKPVPTLDSVVVEFLKKYEVYVDPPQNRNAAEGAITGAVTGLAGADVGGDMAIIQGQNKQTKLQEWTTWKQWALDHKDFEDRKSYDQKLKEVIKQESVDFIILAGFMRILGSDFVKNFPNKIINIHPSLLPKYPGLNTHKKVLENKDKEHGVTVHLVDEGLDSGSIIGYA